MNKIFISYGDSNYFIQRNRIKKQAKSINFFDKVIIYNNSKLDIEFKKKFKKVLNMKRGGGYWVWKYNIILKTLNNMDENDILLYADSGSTINKKGRNRLKEYFDMLYKSEQSFLMFQVKNLIEREWTTKEAFQFFNLNQNSDEALSPVFMATAFLVKKNEAAITFLNEFLEIIEKDPNLITDHYGNNYHQENYFKEHRHDQSILSLMCKTKGCMYIEDETYFFNNPEKQLKYPILSVRDKEYSLWQKIKYFLLYPLNVRKEIFFGMEQPYFKRTPLIKKFMKRVTN